MQCDQTKKGSTQSLNFRYQKKWQIPTASQIYNYSSTYFEAIPTIFVKAAEKSLHFVRNLTARHTAQFHPYIVFSTRLQQDSRSQRTTSEREFSRGIERRLTMSSISAQYNGFCKSSFRVPSLFLLKLPLCHNYSWNQFVSNCSSDFVLS